MVVDRLVLLGRAPRTTSAASNDLPTLVVIDDPYVSGTHLEVAVVEGQVVATDVSRNGTELTDPGQLPGPMVPRQPTRLSNGSRLRLSESIAIEVVIS